MHLSPKEERANELKKGIDDEKKRRSDIINEIRRKRSKLGYKQVEYEAVSKLSTMNTEHVNIGRLRRMKESLEFRISTEAHTLSSEKDLIRKLNVIDEDLNKAIKNFKMKKKLNFIVDDIAQLKKEINELDKKIEESNKKLDDLYGELRTLTDYRRRPKRSEHRERNSNFGGEPKAMSISLEDIAIMKPKKNKSETEENNKEEGE